MIDKCPFIHFFFLIVDLELVILLTSLYNQDCSEVTPRN